MTSAQTEGGSPAHLRSGEVERQSQSVGARDPFFDLWFVIFMAGMACWVIAIPRIDTGAVHHFGLVDVFPGVFHVALALVVLSIIGELHSRTVSRRLLVLQFVGLIVIIHGTAPLLYPEPRYAWVYKHFGVTQYISLHGSVDTNIDIYQNWPMFFALTAWLGDVAGIDSPRNYAEWAQLFFNLCYLVLLTFVYRSLTHNVRVVGLALLMFFLGSWVAQDYFAPQAFSFLFALATYGVILRWLRTDSPKGPFLRLAKRIFPIRQNGLRVDEQPPLHAPTKTARKWATLLLCLFAFVMTASHQLTPYLVLAGTGILVVLNFIRLRVLLIIAAITGAYLLLRIDYVLENYGLFSSVDPLANSRNSTIGPNQGVTGRVLAAQSARLLSGVVIVLALVGFFRRLRQGKREFVPAALMIAPVIIFFGQNYGGEAVYRVYLFAVPWAAFLAAYAVEPITERWRVLRIGLTFVIFSGLAALFIPAYYGLEELNQMRPEEIAAADHYYTAAPPQSVLMTIAPNFPLKANARYDEFAFAATGDNTTSLIVDRSFTNRALGAEDLPAIAEIVRRATEGTGYVVLSESQRIYTEVFEILPPGTFDRLEAAFDSSPDWTVFYRNGDTVIYQLKR